MILFNGHIENMDLSPLREYIKANGVYTKYKRNQYFLHQNELSKYTGFISSGIFRYMRSDTKGNSHIVGYSFTNDFVCDYSTLIREQPSLIDAQAVTPSEIYVLSWRQLDDYWSANKETEHLARQAAEELFITMYQRLLSFHCDTPEERYISLLERYPQLPQYITLKEIASFIGVTPETVSHIRRKLLYKK